mgnify:CR=1 FL=1
MPENRIVDIKEAFIREAEERGYLYDKTYFT